MTAEVRVVGLFAGIGGIELGLRRAGLEAVHLNEIDERARAVLADQFSGVELSTDVRAMTKLPASDVVTAGFPCTDISQAGRKTGISGSQSGLVNEVFRLLESARRPPRWLVLENVSYMLRLDKGRAMQHIIRSLEALGYRWAYRVVDARSFGLPQRRQRVIVVASRIEDPRTVLFADDATVEFNDTIGPVDDRHAYGFYWTEGLRGLGWARDAVPTIKGGSALGIPSPPAIWFPDTGDVGTPQVEDGERLQGFPPGWTLPAVAAGARVGVRWKQIGNAVCVPMSEWVGRRLIDPGEPVDRDWTMQFTGARWPTAAFGGNGKIFCAQVSTTPSATDYSLRKFLALPVKPLSEKATRGFLSRAVTGNLRFSDGFLHSLRAHLDVMRDLGGRAP
ncbi:DNA cytosine methyltransferase [Jatrophihabitans sp.]|uniref:DNA cytosine methyltransferase n=1 Tax=Jatrophihabitans sp. TaxID=1932789 RepID=UPI002C20A4EB|nr:DNA (cytosine-5-)-methyltransferase [Jatrophihabitans sp.]